MPELSNDDILNSIQFPHNKWRRTEELETPGVGAGKVTQLACRNRALVYIHRLRELKMPIDELKSMLENLYWDAFVEHEMQVKESTGKTVKQFFMDKAEKEMVKEDEIPTPTS